MPVKVGSPKAKYLSKKEQIKLESLSPLSPATPSSSAKDAEEFHGRYEMIKALAEGSFGTVWSARDRERVRRREQVVKVAVKIVDHGGEDTELVQNETEMHEKLFADGGGSPLLVKLYDVLFEDLRALLVLEPAQRLGAHILHVAEHALLAALLRAIERRLGDFASGANALRQRCDFAKGAALPEASAKTIRCVECRCKSGEDRAAA